MEVNPHDSRQIDGISPKPLDDNTDTARHQVNHEYRNKINQVNTYILQSTHIISKYSVAAALGTRWIIKTTLISDHRIDKSKINN